MTDSVITNDAGQATVGLEGDLTASTVARWRAVLAELANTDVKQVVFDLGATSVVDSSGIGLLLAAHNSLKRKGGQISVTNASTDVAGLFRAMRLDKHFPVSGR